MTDENKVTLQSQADGTSQKAGAYNFIRRNDQGQIEDSVALSLIAEIRKAGWPAHKTKSIWFKTEVIKEIYDYLNANNRDGVRIYLAKYLAQGYEAVETRKGRQNYNGKHTVVIVPTKDNGDGTSGDDLPNETDLQKLLNEAIKKGITTAYNHGELCPPQTGCR